MASRFPDRIKPEDRDRLHCAAELLTQDLEHPLSLLELAQQVKLNDYKLKAGFRQMLGTTVFGYLHQHRMQEAHRLLQKERISISAVGLRVGHISLSAFSTAFKKFFGVSPSHFQRMSLSSQQHNVAHESISKE